MGRFTGFIGLVVILGVAYLLSSQRHAIRLRILLWGLGLQFLFAVLVLRTDFGKLFQRIGVGVNAMIGYAEVGSEFLFGPLGLKSGPYGVIFAFQVLPIVIFIASFFSILYYLGIMQFIVRWMAVGMQKTMGASGAESLNVAASIFMGQTEAPLTIRPFLPKLTRSELMTVMTAGMAHISGGIMAAYVAFGVEAKHLLAAVIMTAPGTILMAKMLVPETEQPVSGSHVDMSEVEGHKDSNVLAAIARGTTDGLKLAVNVGAMLIAFVALVALLNGVMDAIHGLRGFGWFPVSMQTFFGWIFAVGTVLFLVLSVGSGLLLWGANFSHNMVHNQLSEQKIQFPPLGSPGLDPKEFPGLQRYAGQAVDSGAKAKAYADQFIRVHLTKVADGKTAELELLLLPLLHQEQLLLL